MYLLHLYLSIQGKQTLNSRYEYVPTPPLLKYTGKTDPKLQVGNVPTPPLLKYTGKTDLKLQVGICTYSTFTQVYRENRP